MTFPKRPLELYTRTAEEKLSPTDWRKIISDEHCTYLARRCTKTRKSNPTITIGTCTVGHSGVPMVICPDRFLQGGRIFRDAVPLLQHHEQGNAIHVVSEIAVPGGIIDYFVVSVAGTQVVDYLGLEIQTLDTTGTVWPARQKLIRDLLEDSDDLAKDDRSYNMNWKMTAKTILMQIHHKAETLELHNKKLVLVIQDVFYDYTVREFSTTNLIAADPHQPVHFHVYGLTQDPDGRFEMNLRKQESTTTIGVQQMLGRARDAAVPEQRLIALIQSKIGSDTRLM